MTLFNIRHLELGNFPAGRSRVFGYIVSERLRSLRVI